MNNTKCVIYCRVSTKEQVEGYSLISQERECRNYALKSNIEVVKSFIERGESAKTAERPELQNLLKYITKNKNDIDFVIIHKIDRLSRNVNDTSTLYLLFSRLGIELKSTTENFDSSPTGKFMANIFASIAQLDNDVRCERTVEGMKEALRMGRWVYQAPIGYKFDKSLDGKTNLVPDKNSKLIERTFEYFNKGLYKQVEIINKLEKQGLKVISKQYLNKILRNPLYAGIISTGLVDEPVKGNFTPIISEKDFYTAQSILNSINTGVKKRLRENPDFPLRNLIMCSYCKAPLTGSWSTGRNRRYGYYHCRTKDCKFGNIKKDVLESQFIRTLKNLQPSDKIIELFNQVVIDVWKQKQKDKLELVKKLEIDIKKLKDKKKNIAEFVIKGTFDDETYKEFKNEIDGKIALKTMQLNELSVNYDDIGSCINHCTYFLSNIAKLWITSNINLKVKFQNIIFPEGAIYNNGTIDIDKISTIFKVLQVKDAEESTLVDHRGLEPQ